jgi:hypothetical protein
VIGVAHALYADLVRSLSAGDSRGIIHNARWDVAWRVGPRRLAGKVQERVLTIEAIELAEELQGKGHLTELMALVFDKAQFWGRADYLAFENCADYLLRCLHRKSHFTVDDWRHTRVAWRRFGQMFLDL